MREGASVLLSFLLFSAIGIPFVLPVLIPPIRRWLRAETERRILVLFTYGLLIFLLFFVTWSYLSASIQTVFFCYSGFGVLEHEENFVDKVYVKRRASPKHSITGCRSSDADRLGFADVEEMKEALTQEFFQRNVTPPPFRQDCYHENRAFCEFADSSPASDSSFLFGFIIPLWPTMVAVFLMWRWIRPKKVKANGEEL